MTNYREILRLKNLGLNNTQIAAGCSISRTTVLKVVQRAAECNISFNMTQELSDNELTKLLFPSENNKPAYTMPDYEYIHREMAKSGVTLTLLWLEYCDKCRDNQEMPYQFTQFKKYYRDFVVKTKATMHINRKPGEIMEVDWAGQTASIIDMFPPKENEARDLLEIVESRYKKASTVFCSQFEVAGWHHKIGEPTLADAICDRIVHDSYTIVIGGKDSMRKRKGIIQI